MEQNTSYREIKHSKGKVEMICWIKGHGHVFTFKVLILFELCLPLVMELLLSPEYSNWVAEISETTHN